VNFANPAWLAAGLLSAAALIWLWRRYDARQQAALAKFVSAHLRQQLTRSISPGRRRLQRGLFLGALIALFAALAGPQVGFHWEQVSRRGNEIIFAIDTSRSMLTADVKPNRLTRAKLAIDDFAKKLDGDAVGIVAFAGTAFLACPVTLDYGAFHESLAAVDTSTIPRGGTNISAAIQAGQAALRRRPGSDKIMILVTDGEDLEGSAFEAAEAAAKADGIKIYTVGVGTAAGDLIPIPPAYGGGFVKDETGAFVRSRLDEQGLKAIAGATGGFYVPLGVQAEGLELIFQNVLGSIAKHELASRQQKIYIERYQWPLAASLAMLLSSLLIGSRRRNRPPFSALAAAPFAAVPLGILLLAFWLSIAQAASIAGPKEPIVEYNAGTAAYRSGQFPQAAQSFQQSITHSPSDDPKRLAVQQDAYYNLGNTLYRAGQKTEKTSPQETVQKWNEAVKAYDTALQMRADDADSKYNRDLVKRKIDALQNQQNPQNQGNQQNKNKNQNQNQNQDNKQNQDQNQKQNQKQDQKQDPNQKQDQNPNQGQGQNNDQNQNKEPNQGQNPANGPQQGKDQPPDKGPGQPPGQDPNQGQGAPPPPKAGDAKGDQPPGSADPQAADNQRVPGQMSREEARELLDSVKGDEHQSMPIPWTQRGGVPPPDKPFKNW
jgi:Ca-activated chloride channel family protein